MAFSNLNVPTNAIATQALNTYTLLPTDAYTATIKKAYQQSSSTSSSSALALELEIIHENKPRKLTQQLWVTTKEGKCTYEKGGKLFYLPGFVTADAIAKIVTGKSITELTTEKRVYELYGEEREVEAFTELNGKQVGLVIEEQIVNKTDKSPVNGKYEPINAEESKNEVLMAVMPETFLTLVEVNAGATESKTVAEWLNQKKGKVNNCFKPVAASGSSSGSATKPVTYG